MRVVKIGKHIINVNNIVCVYYSNTECPQIDIDFNVPGKPGDLSGLRFGDNAHEGFNDAVLLYNYLSDICIQLEPEEGGPFAPPPKYPEKPS